MLVLRSTAVPTSRPSSAASALPEPSDRRPRRRESVETTLAKNLVLARLAEGVTQKELASASDVSRATIAQLETGVSDPRVSTVAELARALGLPAAFLLLSAEEIGALVRLVDEIRAQPVEVLPEEAARIRELLGTGLLRDRNRAARIGAELVRGTPGASPAATALAAIFTTVAPNHGPAVAAALGRLVEGNPASATPKSDDRV